MNIFKSLTFVLLCCLGFTLVYSYPSFDFSTSSYPSGQVNITGQASVGTTIGLEVNGDFVGTDTINPSTTIISLMGSIQDLTLGQGVLYTFENVDSLNVYRLRFTQNSQELLFQTLNPGQSFEYRFEDSGTVNVINEETSEQVTFSIEDQVSGFSFTNIPQTSLQDGENTLNFEILYFEDGLQTSITEQRTFSYERFDNTISLNSPESLLSEREVTIRGSVSEVSYPLYYIKNYDGEIANIGQLTPIELEGNTFEVEISNLAQGNNSIRFISLASESSLIITGETTHEIFVDTIPPSLELLSASFGNQGETRNLDVSEQEFYVSENRLVLNYSTDAERLVYSLNERDFSVPLVRESQLDLSEMIRDYIITSDGRELSFELDFEGVASQGQITYTYNGREGSEPISSSQAEFDINLDENSNTIVLVIEDNSGVEETISLEILDYAFEEFENGDTGEVEVENGIGTLELSLSRGQNNLTVYAYDSVGNEFKQARAIIYDDLKPELVRDSLEPEELFTGSRTARSFFQQIEGEVNKPNVKVTVFSILKDVETYDGDLNPASVTCNDFRPLFVRNLGDLDPDRRPRGPEIDPDEVQLSLSLQTLIFAKDEATANSNGEFDVIIGLQERDFDRRDYYEAASDSQQTINTVRSRNELCFVLEDRFGNIEIESFSVTLDAGNTLWRPGEITTTPNTLYASEISMTGDQRQGTGRQRFGMIARFDYIGAGQVSDFRQVRIDVDRQSGKHSRNARVVQSEVNYMMDKDTGQLVVYAPVEITPLDIPASEYPSEFEVGFAARVTYSIDDTNIPIDTQNPIFFTTSVNVERPFDHTRWLSPDTIDNTIEFLNKSLEFTEKAVEWTRIGSIAGVLTCTGAKFYLGAQIGMTDNEKEKEKLREQLYMICDRVACSAAPNECNEFDSENFETSDPGVLQIPENQRSFDESELGQATITRSGEENERLARFNSLQVLGECNYDGDNSTLDGVRITGTVTTFENTGGVWATTNSQSRELVRDQCVRKKQVGENTFIDLRTASGVCYNPNPPYYDNTRCNFFGMDQEGVPGLDPSDNIFESLRCGCITDTYSHLKTIHRVQEGIQKCLQQAKVGEVKGAYCERLMAVAVCDVATNVVFKLDGDAFSMNPRQDGEGNDPRNEEGFFANLQAFREEDKQIDQRYQGTLLSQTGLSTDQIVNKACIGAITGDFSILSENILNAVETNEVEPVFGPAFPTSRMLGYNPFTGELSIDYRFTYGVVSGGQPISTQVKFACDPSLPGSEYCPPGYEENKRDNSNLNVRTLNVREGGATQDLIVSTDTEARYWFNKLILEHTYTLKGERKTSVQEFSIKHSGQLLNNCYWSGGVMGSGAQGLTCDNLFTDDALASAYDINERSTYLIPNNGGSPIYTTGQPVMLNLNYDVKSQAQGTDAGFDLAYKAVCRSPSNEPSVLMDYITVRDGARFGEKQFVLFNIPTIGESIEERSKIFSREINPEDIADAYSFKLRFTNTDLSGKSISITQISPIEISTEEGLNLRSEFSIVERSQENPGSKDIRLEGKIQSNQDLLVEIEGETSNVQLSLIKVDPEGNQIGSPIPIIAQRDRINPNTNQFDTLLPGTCSLELRLAPPGKGQAITSSVSDFEEFNIYDDNIEVDSTLRDESKHELSFTVVEEATEGESSYGFEIIEPRENGVICAAPGTTKELKYVYLENVAPNDEYNLTLDYSISSERYALDFGEGRTKLVPISEELPKDELKRVGIFKMNIPSSLSNEEDDNDGTPLFNAAGNSEVLDMILAYQIKRDGSETLESETIRFKLQVADNCGEENKTNRKLGSTDG